MARLARFVMTGVPYHITRRGDALTAEYDGAGTMLRRYAHGSNAVADDPLVWYEGAGVATSAARIPKANRQGSIVAHSDWGGALHSINSYDEWGIPGAGNQGRFQYTGQAWLPELGMYHYKARIYSPTLGRFLQTDPVGYKDQINLYAYVGNDPVNMLDPTGSMAEKKETEELRPYQIAVQYKGDFIDTKIDLKIDGDIGEALTETSAVLDQVSESINSVSDTINASSNLSLYEMPSKAIEIGEFLVNDPLSGTAESTLDVRQETREDAAKLEHANSLQRRPEQVGLAPRPRSALGKSIEKMNKIVKIINNILEN